MPAAPDDLLAELAWRAGDLQLRVFRESSDETLMTSHSGEPEFAELARILKLDMHVSLLQMEHDLMDDCCCETCFRAWEIRRRYEG